MNHEPNNNPNGEDIEFQLLTEGLGFQKSLLRSEKILTPKTPNLAGAPQLPPSFRASEKSGHQLPKQSLVSLEDKQQLLTNSFSKNGNRSIKSSNILSEIPNVEEVPDVDPADVSLLKQFFAWSVDFSLLFALVATSVIYLDQLNPGLWSDLDGNFLWNEASFYFAWFFSMLYMIYFSLSEAFGGQSVGKYLFKLQVVDAFGDRPKIYQTLLRSMISLALILTAGFLAIYQIQGLLSRTKLQLVAHAKGARREELV
jgi:uncharacterized RDD family membrane protein YckC